MREGHTNKAYENGLRGKKAKKSSTEIYLSVLRHGTNSSTYCRSGVSLITWFVRVGYGSI